MKLYNGRAFPKDTDRNAAPYLAFVASDFAADKREDADWETAPQGEYGAGIPICRGIDAKAEIVDAHRNAYKVRTHKGLPHIIYYMAFAGVGKQ